MTTYEHAQLTTGTVRYRVTGPVDGAHPPVVFVHGFLVDGRLWDGVADRLAALGMRCYLPDWPLGSHREPMPGADLSPRGVAGLVLEFIDALGLRDVTLVGSDTGGALCQLAIDRDQPNPSGGPAAGHARRIGRLVLTNCDAFENFPPRLFRPLFRLVRSPAATAVVLRLSGPRPLRHSPLAFGMLMNHPLDAKLTKAWLAPAADPRIRADIANFARGFDRTDLVELAPRLQRFPGPVRIVWGMRDRNFTPATGRRLADAFAHAEFVAVPDATTFVSIDRPEAVAAAVQSVVAA